METAHIDQLKKVPLFKGVAADVLAEVASQCEVRQFSMGSTIFREGDRAGELFLVLTGEVAVTKATEEGDVPLARLRPFSCFGDMSLFDKAPRSASATAKTDCSLLCVAGDTLRPVCRRHPELYESFIKILSLRLRQTGARLASLA